MQKRRQITAVSSKVAQGDLLVGMVRQHNVRKSQPDNVDSRKELQETVRIQENVLTDSLTGYQSKALRTRGDFGDSKELLVFSALEVTAEAGEISNLIYKHVFQGHPLNISSLLEEIGDVLWGLASLADAAGSDLYEVGSLNIEKLAKRYSSGRFTTEDSIARRDHDNI